MSDNLVDEVTEENDVVEEVVDEQLESPAGDDAEDSTQETAEETIETISINDLGGETQAQSDEEDKQKQQKELNNVYARTRKAKKRLKQLEEQVESGTLPQEFAYKPQEAKPEPQLAEFQNRLYDDFEGDSNLMLAHFNEARRQYDASHQSDKQAMQAHNDSLREQIRLEREAEERFQANVEQFAAVVPDLDDGLAKAEKLLGEQDFNSVRSIVGDNAPLVLGLIGANKDVQNGLQQAVFNATQAQNPTELIKYLTRLEDKVSSGLPRNKISKAKAETPLSGSPNVDQFEKQLKNIEAGKGEYKNLSAFEKRTAIRKLQKEREAG